MRLHGRQFARRVRRAGRVVHERGSVSVKASIVILFLFAIAAAFGSWLAPHSPTALNLTSRLVAPFGFAGGSSHFVLGTDNLGRDILSRLIVGTRVTFELAVATVAAACALGTVFGVMSGMAVALPGTKRNYRWVDVVLMRGTDLVLSVPLILIALMLVVAVGESFSTLLVILVVFSWPSYARVVRGRTVAICSESYIDLAVLSGTRARVIAFRHVLPNLLDSIIVVATLQLGYVILLAAALDFLGAGIPPPTPTWGGMVSDGQEVLGQAWWVSTIPGLAIALVVFSANTLGDWLRDVLDPQLEGLQMVRRDDEAHA